MPCLAGCGRVMIFGRNNGTESLYSLWIITPLNVGMKPPNLHAKMT